uniref:Uncharacterized protein n=1 Tax=Tanacetum cinerariifolium TaxID=118510 RepID=A0A6L2JR36_TANCI|nr:hypothetical protein [Tanacetum cinerariifolium]
MKIRSSILSRETLPDVRSAYAIISYEESYTVSSGSLNRLTTRGSALVYENYGFNGHTIDKRFKIIRYPIDLGKNKVGSNFKGKNVTNNNSVRSSSSNGFSDKQMATLISLIKENYVNGKGVQWQGLIIDSGANQHMTYTNTNLFNVIDVSYLKIKVSLPNGTWDEAFITKIGNMPLTNYLTLYDVLVVPDYCVRLMSVHKVARNRTGKQIGGLYYFDGNQGIDFENLKNNNVCFLSKQTWHCRLGHPADQVRDVFKSTINFDNKESDLMCNTCQTAKQTREPFPLSDLVSTELRELVHLDFWGPYKVTSRDSTSKKYVLVGYLNFRKVYKLWSLDNKQIIYYIDVKFFEDIFPFKQNMSTKIDTSILDVNHLNFLNTNTLDDLSDMLNNKERRNHSPNRHVNSPSHSGSPSASSKGNDRGQFQDVDASFSKSESFAALEKNNSSFDERYCFATMLNKGFEPKTYLEASQHKHWVDAMNAKLDALYRNNTWELADLPLRRKAIGFKWVFKIKYKSDGEIERFEASLFPKSCGDVYIALLVYVNDIIIIGNGLPEINKVKQFLKTNFMVKDLGKLKYFLGIEVLDTSNGVSFNQRKHFLELIDEFGLLIGNQVFEGSPGKGINVINRSASAIDLKAYPDADWARCTDIRRSLTGYCVFMCGSMVSWKSKKQNIISKSSTKAEHRALAYVTSEVIWILKILIELKCSNLLPVKVFCDNNSAIKFAANPIFHERTKHHEIDLHFVKEKLLLG